jgi:hypothetical protein
VLETVAILFAAGGEAKRAACELVTEVKIVGGGAKVLNAHAYFALRREEEVNGLGLRFGAGSLRSGGQRSEGAKEESPVWERIEVRGHARWRRSESITTTL